MDRFLCSWVLVFYYLLPQKSSCKHLHSSKKKTFYLNNFLFAWINDRQTATWTRFILQDTLHLHTQGTIMLHAPHMSFGISILIILITAEITEHKRWSYALMKSVLRRECWIQKVLKTWKNSHQKITQTTKEAQTNRLPKRQTAQRHYRTLIKLQNMY